ncbi:hypothetical protein C8F04DRAFT_1396242 [Mycena alexandri]|uniref:Uncharacterized protein n=1 Tax=Mycena alexandri TaxID=1745969 RepID=A0AAD6SRY0_9AGAR|nr:hypothetical protein C8F04DRAFT_1396242 [Mycena alexandri]
MAAELVPLPSSYGRSYVAASPPDEDTADSLLVSETTWRMADKASGESSFTTSKTLRICSAILHSTLIVVYVILLVIWAKGLEHRFTVSLKHEKLISSLITATTTAFGTIYSAALVFVSQSLSVRRNLQVNQYLTATHDTAAAWAGLGASILYMWLKKWMYAAGSLYSYFLPSVLESTTSLGLQEGTLHDVLNTTSAVAGNATVNATGFDVTCGYVVDIPDGFLYANNTYQIFLTDPGFISSAKVLDSNSITLYSTIPILDSSGDSQGWANPSNLRTIDGVWTESVAANIQLFQCSLSLVNQTATVDSQSNQLQALGPRFANASTWRPYTGILHTIWLYRNHPELDTLLEQVEESTTDNLRAAGMLRTRLLDHKIFKQKYEESTE